jgi:hypothetical protein
MEGIPMHRPGRLTRILIAAGLLLAIASAVVACGSFSTFSTAEAGTEIGPTEPPASVAAPTEPAATPAASTAAGGGGAAGLACDLLTAEEASGVIGGGAFTPESLPGDPSYCTYKTADGGSALSVSLGQKDAKMAYDAWASASDTVKVDGIGDGAAWVPSLNTLLILKGDKVMGITAGPAGVEGDQRLDWSKALGAIAVSRM